MYRKKPHLGQKIKIGVKYRMEAKGNLLVVDDEIRIRRMLQDYLNGCSYEVIEAKDGEEAMKVFFEQNNKIDMILLDIMMPNKNGYQVLSEIRECSDVPIIMLTAKGEEYNQLDSFKHGADDFIAKPISLAVLKAHIEAVMKRCNRQKKDERKVGLLSIDEEKMSVKKQGEPLELTPKEYDLLLFFVKNEGVVFKRETILNSVWTYNYEGDIRTVDTHVKQLRAKLSEECPYIKTVHRIGYKFEV